MVDRPRRQRCGGTVEAARLAAPKSHRRGRAERNTNDMLEHRPVAVPSDAGPRIVADEQSLDELVRGEVCELRNSFAQRQEPFGDRVCPREAGVVEIIAPAKRRGQPLAEPSMEAERRQLQPVDGRDKRLFLARPDNVTPRATISNAEGWHLSGTSAVA